jgi:hypothetical protein
MEIIFLIIIVIIFVREDMKSNARLTVNQDNDDDNSGHSF